MLRKKELLRLPELVSVEKGINARAEVIEIGGRQILHIDVTNYDCVIVRYFADKEGSKWLVHGVKAGWTKMGLLSAIDYELSNGRYYGYDYYGRRAYGISAAPSFGGNSLVVQEYICDGRWCYGSADRMITDWEMKCRENLREKAIESRHRRIDDLMDRVPKIPDGFEQWLGSKIFTEDYLYTKKKGDKTEYICTACGKGGARKIKVKAGDMVTCPRCGKTVKARSLGRRYKPKQAHIVLMQTMDIPRERTALLKEFIGSRKAYVERQMTVYCRAMAGKKDFDIYEDLRAVVPERDNWGIVFYGQLGDGTPETQIYWDHNGRNKRWKSSYLYPGNLDEVLPVANMEHSGLDILAKKTVRINVNFFVVNYPGRPWIEYLIKAGLYRLTKDLTDGGLFYEWNGAINKKGRTLQECLMLDGGRVSRLRQVDGGIATLEWLRCEKNTGRKITQESVEFFTKNAISPWEVTVAQMLKKIGSPNKLANYIAKQMQKNGSAASTVLSTWHDYMDMCRRLKKQVDNEMIYKPRDVRLAHDECLALLKREDAGKRAAEVREKFPEAELNLQMIADKYNFTDDEYQIIVPESIEDIIVEGATLGHCIDRTDVYFERIQNRTSYLVFLRKAERPEAPWYTLEIEPGGTIRQKRTVGNTQRDSDIKAFTPFLREWQKNVLRKMNREDKALAQASKEARLEEYGQLRARKEPIRNGLLRGQLLADVLEADLMEAM